MWIYRLSDLHTYCKREAIGELSPAAPLLYLVACYNGRMKWYGSWRANTQYEKAYVLFPTIVIMRAYDEWSITMTWLSSGFVIEL